MKWKLLSMIYQEEILQAHIQQFENKTLAIEKWTHEAHLIVGLWYNWHYEKDEAINKARIGISTYNEAVGTANTDNSGYHETITIFWMKITRKFIQRHKGKPLVSIVNLFLKSIYADKTLLFKYYTEELLFSKQARKHWVDPNLTPSAR